MASFVAHATRGLIREPRTRRKMMFVAILLAAGLALAGSTILQGVLNPREHLVWFTLFWFACAWLTLLAVLLAVFDLLLVRAQARAARKNLRERYPASLTPDSPSKRSGE